MFLFLFVFVFWLALQGKLKIYADFAMTGTPLSFSSLFGFAGLTGAASRAMGGTGTPNPPGGATTSSGQPVFNPPTPSGQGPLDSIWNKIGGIFGAPIGQGSTPTTAPPGPTNPGSGTVF